MAAPINYINISTHSPHRPGALLTILTYSVLVVPQWARVNRHADLGGVGLREARTNRRKPARLLSGLPVRTYRSRWL